MRCFAAALGAWVMLAAAPASADVWIQQDYGGQIGPYLAHFAQVRASGERVIIDGSCFSACTLVTAVVPANRICITPRAMLGFHAAWLPDEDGRPVISRGGTQVLWRFYPPRIRSWINRHGGLTGRTIFLRGRELASMYRPCVGVRDADRSADRSGKAVHLTSRTESRARSRMQGTEPRVWRRRPELSAARIAPM